MRNHEKQRLQATIEGVKYMQKMNFDERLKQVVAILKDRNVTEMGKENVLNDFLEEYENFDSTYFDKYIK